MISQIENAICTLAEKIATGSRVYESKEHAEAIVLLSDALSKLNPCNGGAWVERIMEKLSNLESNLGVIIMTTKDEVLAAAAAETQEVLDKINADRAEIDAAKADLAAKAVLIADLQAQIDALVAAGNGVPAADLAEIKAAIEAIFTPVP